MIRHDDVFKIGRLGSTHGLKGEIDFRYTDDIFTSEDGDYLVLDIDGLLVPFFLEDWRVCNSEQALVKFEGYDSMETTAILQNAEVYYPKAAVKTSREELTSWKMLTGFTVSDSRVGLLGTVSEVDDSSANTLLIVSPAEGEEIILPVHPDLVEDIDLNDRTLMLNLPEGLVG